MDKTKLAMCKHHQNIKQLQCGQFSVTSTKMLHIIKTSLAKLITVQSEVELTEKLQFSYTIISQ